MIRFVCECGRQLQARDDDLGKKARCPSCDRVMTVPSEAVADVPRRKRSEAGREDYDYEDDARDEPRPPREASGKALAAMIFGLVSLCLPCIPAVFGLVFGVLALSQIGNSRG